MERIPGFMASAYNKAARMAIGGYYSQVADEIVSELKSGVVLDIGTGPGYLPIEIVKRAPAVKVVGVDLTPELIKMAQGNRVKTGVADRLRFEVMDAANLQFGDKSYDMVFSTGMLHALRSSEKVSKVIRESYRVLKPGGELWIFDPAKICSVVDTSVWKASLSLWEKVLYKLFASYELLNPPHYYSREEIFRIISITDFYNCRIQEKDNEIKIKLRKP